MNCPKGIIQSCCGDGSTYTAVPIFYSQKSFTAVCTQGRSGAPVTATASYTSNISQDDADAQALYAATQLAESKIQCS